MLRRLREWLRRNLVGYCACGEPSCGGGCAPRCYGSRPNAQERAENDCWHCRHRGACSGI